MDKCLKAHCRVEFFILFHRPCQEMLKLFEKYHGGTELGGYSKTLGNSIFQADKR